MVRAKCRPGSSRSGKEGSKSLSDQSGEDFQSSSEGSNDIDGEEGSEEEELDNENVEALAVKVLRVQADMDEMRRMMDDMDTIKTQLQQRFNAQRQASIQKREVLVAANKSYEEAGMQTEPIVIDQQMDLSQQASRPPQTVDDGKSGALASTLPAAIETTKLAVAAPIKPKPAGLSIYDLVKAPCCGLSRKAPSPVNCRADPLVSKRASQSERKVNDVQQSDAGRSWSGDNSRFNAEEDGIMDSSGHVGDCENDRYLQRDDSLNSADSISKHRNEQQSAPQLSLSNENSASLSNSLVSSDADNRDAVFSDPIEPRNQKLGAAALLSTSKISHSLTTNDDDEKSDEQRELEAIRCLLFHYDAHTNLQ